MEAKLAVVVVEGCVELMRPMDPAPIDDHHDLFLGFLEGCHDLVNILAKLLSIKMRDNLSLLQKYIWQAAYIREAT